VKIFNWIATMWQGSMTFETPMLFAVGFIFVFTMGGFTGLILAMAPIDIQLQDTYYVVAHFHYVLVAGSLYAMFAGYLLLGAQVDWRDVQRNARQDPLLVVVDRLQRDLLPHALPGSGRHATPLCRLPHAVRRLQCDCYRWVHLHSVWLRCTSSSVSSCLPCWARARKPAQKPWEAAEGLEWEVPSPAPFHTFENPPKLDATATKVIG